MLTTLSTLAAYLISAKGGDDQYRFLLPIVCCFPFIVAYVIDRLSILVLKQALQIVLVAYAGFNVATTVSMTQRWMDEENGVSDFAYTYRPTRKALVIGLRTFYLFISFESNSISYPE